MKLVQELHSMWSNFSSKFARKDKRNKKWQSKKEHVQQLQTEGDLFDFERWEKTQKKLDDEIMYLNDKQKKLEKAEKKLQKEFQQRVKKREREQNIEMEFWKNIKDSVEVGRDEKELEDELNSKPEKKENTWSRKQEQIQRRLEKARAQEMLRLEKIREIQQQEEEERKQEMEIELQRKMEKQRKREMRQRELERKKEIERQQEEKRKEEEAKEAQEEKEEECGERQLDVQKIQEARRVHMNKERRRKKEMMKKMMSPEESLFRATDERALQRGIREKRRTPVLTPVEKNEQSPEPEIKQDKPVVIPRFISVKPLNPISSEPEDEPETTPSPPTDCSSSPEEDVSVWDVLKEAHSDDFSNQEKPVISKAKKLKAILARPLPMVKLAQCCVQRDRSNRSCPTYRMYNDDTKELLMVARKINKKNILIESDNRSLGLLRFKKNCTVFTLYNKIINLSGNSEEEHSEQELITVSYTTSFKTLSKISVVLPSNIPAHKISLENKAPEWDEDKAAYTLNFNGRAKRTSCKNFQLIAPEKPDAVVMQFGRMAEDWFALDYSTPLNALQAFAISLSCFEAQQ